MAYLMKSILLTLLTSTGLALFTACTASAAPGTGAGFKGPIGLQLYSLRDQFKSDVPGTLDEVKKWGIKYVELAGTYDMPPKQFKAELDKRGLVPISAHFPYEAWIPHEGDFTEKTCREAIAVFNKAGEALARHGLKFFYHTHGYEFQPQGQGTLLDLLITETNPKYVSYEMDIFWIVHPGQDPAKLLDKYAKRWELMHLKDMKKGTPTGLLTGHTDVTNDAALGTGQMDLPAILRAAKKAGVKWYFIEDESPWSEQQIPQSLKYLEQVSG